MPVNFLGALINDSDITPYGQSGWNADGTFTFDALEETAARRASADPQEGDPAPGSVRAYLRDTVAPRLASPAGPTALPANSSNHGAIVEAAQATGLDPAMLKTFAHVESFSNARTQTGKYKGLFQLSDTKFKRYGGGDIWNARDNANAAARKLKAEMADFKAVYGRDPSAADIYLVHQQGSGGYAEHTATPNEAAWKSMQRTREGQQRGEKWAKAAIWRNIPDKEKNSPGFSKERFKSVDNVTSAQFTGGWSNRINGIHRAYGTATAPSVPTRADLDTPTSVKTYKVNPRTGEVEAP